MAETEQCYHKGCGKKYDPEANDEGSCQYHPGEPVFHDSLKGWSCCNKKSADFSEFLNILGCTSGKHSNVKLLPEEKPVPIEVVREEIIIQAPPAKPTPLHERPSFEQEKTTLTMTVAPTLKSALQKRAAAKQEMVTDITEHGGESIAIGTSCSKNGCSSRFSGESSYTDVCLHHPGAPIFHEGMKYWSCCQRKTTEFDKFMDQKGCEKGQHVWSSARDKQKKVSCRVDWHQTGGTVVISVFAKCSDPPKTIIKANQVALTIYIVFEDDELYTDDIILYGVIDPAKSTVKMMGAKVEIVLKKAEPINWPSLHYKKPPQEPVANEEN